MAIRFRAFAALHEDISAPYIWLSDRPEMRRPLATLKNTRNRQKVVCQILKVDRNFRDRYNASSQTLALPADTSVAVMSEWCRNCLGVQTGDTVESQIKTVCRCFLSFAQLRASFSHPDHNARLAADLAAVSVLLGLIGLALGIIGLIR